MKSERRAGALKSSLESASFDHDARHLTEARQPTSLDAEALFLEEVARARAMSAEDKLLEGPRLFERAWRLMADGIRHQHPEFDDDQVYAMLVERLRQLRDLENR